MNNKASQEQIKQLYEKYRKEGGFGIYSIERLCARNVNIEEKIYQETTITELYSVVYNREISKSILEHYLGRKCMGAYERCSLQLKYGIPKECITRYEDPFKTFIKCYRVDGHINRMYLKEKTNELDRFQSINNAYIVTKPILVRTTSSTKLI